MRIESPADSLGNTAVSTPGGAKSGALSPDLQKIIDAWPELPEAIKTGILAFRAAGK